MGKGGRRRRRRRIGRRVGEGRTRPARQAAAQEELAALLAPAPVVAEPVPVLDIIGSPRLAPGEMRVGPPPCVIRWGHGQAVVDADQVEQLARDLMATANSRARRAVVVLEGLGQHGALAPGAARKMATDWLKVSASAVYDERMARALEDFQGAGPEEIAGLFSYVRMAAEVDDPDQEAVRAAREQDLRDLQERLGG